MKLHLGEGLALPLEAVTETFGLLAVRGAGKSNAARVMAEEMFKAGLPFVAIDPVGSWKGLRASRDGKGPGLPIPIFGGKWGDVPLEREGGQLLADLVVDQRLSCVIDLSGFETESPKRSFLLAFARRLYARNEQPLHLFLEEADDYIPEGKHRELLEVRRAWENIVRRGRARGIGCTIITQRSASIAKDVLTQVQTLIAMRTTGPQDVAAIATWLKYHAQGQDILATLAKLQSGEAWVWSPVFLGTTKRIRFRLSETFDSGATPSGKTTKAATLADVDLADVKKRMAATIERAKAEDPRELRKGIEVHRKRIAELEHQLAAAPKEGPAKEVKVPAVSPVSEKQLLEAAKKIERAAAILNGLVARAAETGLLLSAAAREVGDNAHSLGNAAQVVVTELGLAKSGRAVQTSAPATSGAMHPAPGFAVVHRPDRVAPAPARRAPTGDDASLSAMWKAILTALAQHRSGLTKRQLLIHAGYAASGRCPRPSPSPPAATGSSATAGWWESRAQARRPSARTNPSRVGRRSGITSSSGHRRWRERCSRSSSLPTPDHCRRGRSSRPPGTPLAARCPRPSRSSRGSTMR